MAQDMRFPDGFYWGTATSSHQVEGNNRKNDWWQFEQVPGKIKDGTTSGPACDHYNRFEEDFTLSQEFGHNAHRFSIEWSRIEPENGRWDEKEVEHYQKVVESLHSQDIVPFVTLHHFCHPVWFAEMGGWTSDEAPERMGRYAGYMAKKLGDAVPFWMTINEPPVLPAASYIAGVFPPAKRDMALAMVAMRNILKSLATMHNAVRENAPHNPKIGPVINMTYAMPASDSDEDKQAAQQMDQYWNKFWLDGLRDGVMGPPAGSGEEIPGLKGAWDFVGLNYYSRSVVAHSRGIMGLRQVPPPEGSECSTMGWQVYPEGFYQCMMRLKEYGLPVYVTENGIGTDDDEQRISYLVRHLYQVRRALNDGVDVRSYLHWCQQDNFEWAEGYRQKFGLFEREEGTLNRIPKPSAYAFKDWAQNNRVPAELVAKYVEEA
jgi:beta-glucosidase